MKTKSKECCTNYNAHENALTSYCYFWTFIFFFFNSSLNSLRNKQNQSINWSINQTMNRSINQSLFNLSIDHWKKIKNYFDKREVGNLADIPYCSVLLFYRRVLHLDSVHILRCNYRRDIHLHTLKYNNMSPFYAWLFLS